MEQPIRVGIIGANASGGWAREGHVPAVQMLPGMKLVAIATNSRQTADASGRAFGVAGAYASGLELIAASDIDLVTVATRVPDHRDLVLAAIAAGKHIYCEWPLGRGIAETEEMSAAARAAGVHVAIGLQLRGNPVVRRARQLVLSNAIGRVLSVNVYSATAGFGPRVPEPYAYLEDPDNFANLITIQGAHTIDLAVFIAGALADLSALATAQYPEITVGEKHEKRRRVTYDHLRVQSRLAGGASLAIEVAGGRPPETAFDFEIVGETGVLRLSGGATRGFQSGRIFLSLNGNQQRVDEGELTRIPDAAANVAGIYEVLRDDIVKGTYTVASFEHAIQLTQLVIDLMASSQTGIRVNSKNWPER